MTPDRTFSSAPDQERGLRALVYAALPPQARPTNTLCHALSRRVLERAQGDIVELTRQKLSIELGNEPHVIICLRDGDLDAKTDADLLHMLEQTDGGVLVFGISYAEEDSL
jgi:hypothetical protein